jgi:hypothetical protein
LRTSQVGVARAGDVTALGGVADGAAVVLLLVVDTGVLADGTGTAPHPASARAVTQARAAPTLLIDARRVPVVLIIPRSVDGEAVAARGDCENTFPFVAP